MKKNIIIISVIVFGLVLATSILFIVRKASNEILESFGTLNEQFEDINTTNQTKIDSMQNIVMYAEFRDQFEALDVINQDFNYYIDNLKIQLLANVEDPTDYSKMDSTTIGNAFFFTTDGYTEKGQEFVDIVDAYKKDVKNLFRNESIDIDKELKELFNNHEGVDDWLEYNYKDFPLVATLTKLTQMSADLAGFKINVLNKLLSK